MMTRKIKLLLDYAGKIGASIADPWYTGNFNVTYEDIVEGCFAFLDYCATNDKLKREEIRRYHGVKGF